MSHRSPIRMSVPPIESKTKGYIPFDYHHIRNPLLQTQPDDSVVPDAVPAVQLAQAQKHHTDFPVPAVPQAASTSGNKASRADGSMKNVDHPVEPVETAAHVALARADVAGEETVKPAGPVLDQGE